MKATYGHIAVCNPYAIHSFKRMKIIQICQSGGHGFLQLVDIFHIKKKSFLRGSDKKGCLAPKGLAFQALRYFVSFTSPQVSPQHEGNMYIVPLDMKGCICHFAK